MDAPASRAVEEPPLEARYGAVTVVFGRDNGKYPDGNQVLVQGRDSRIAFDTPLVANRIGAAFDGVDAVLLSHVHEDHMAALHRVPHAEVWVHQADVAAARSWAGLARHYGYADEVLERLKSRIEHDFSYAPRPDARGYADGARWDLGGVSVHAVHLPGHTAGHCALFVEPDGIAFIGDIDLSGFGPYYGDACSDLGDFRRSLARLAELPARVWITSHHKGVVDERARFDAMLAAYAARLDEREAVILGWLAEGQATLEQLARRRLLYPPEHDALWVDAAERRSIEMHLAELQAGGMVRRSRSGRYRLNGQVLTPAAARQ